MANPSPDQIRTEAQAASDKHKKMAANSILLKVAGELIMARCPDKSLSVPFKRYQLLLESFANTSKEERIINYKMLCALVLTSHAKKLKEKDKKRELFEIKNQLFYDLANDPVARRKVGLKYLGSSTFRVVKYCDSCQESNAKAELPKHKWKFCNSCEIDRNFYNVLCMHRKFDGGHASIFLSNDRVGEIKGFKAQIKGKRESFEEEARFDKYRYTVKNLDAFALDSILKLSQKLLAK